ncbi:MAG: SDR family NAD(P)-dependent oxidoreductase [Acidimicrobiia bacterium]
MSKLSIATFTNLGYLAHARNFEPVDADLSGQTIVVTGATGGLGRQASLQLARLGARLVAVGRDPAKLEALTSESDGVVIGIRADLSMMSDIRDLATRIIDSEPRVDVLINNVGVLLPERTETDEMIETTLATNLAGQFLLTNLLIPRLRESAPSRVVMVSSGGMYAERVRPDDLGYGRGEYSGASAYARTKRGQVILTEMWADRHAGSGISFHAMHPGWAKTEGVKRSLPVFNTLMKPLLRTPAQGADTIVWLASAPEPGMTNGRFWFDRKPAPTHLIESTRETLEDRELLWDNLETLTGVKPQRTAS